MNRQEIGSFIIGFGTGIAFTATLSGIYCLYFRKKKPLCQCLNETK